MSEDERGLDHLMEQNETDLPFLSAYGGLSQASSHTSEAILEALVRYLRAGGCHVDEQNEGVSFGFGSASSNEGGCQVSVEGDVLPLVPSDVIANGFANGFLSEDRRRVSVMLTDWGADQRRFIERLVEHALHD